MKSRGVLGVLGVIADYQAFRRQGYRRSMAARAAFDYWVRDITIWMGLDGRPRDPRFRA